MKKLSSIRIMFLWVFVLCAIAIGLALYFQLVDGMVPCVLCVSQRLMVVALAIISLIALIHGPKLRGVRIYSALLFIFSVLGCWFAARQVWLQHLPPGKAPACGPGFDFLLKSLPPKDLLVLLFKGTGDCAVVHWHALGMTMPEWSLLFFLLIVMISLWQFFRQG